MSMQFNTSSHLQYPEFSSSVRHKTSKSIAHNLPMNYREYQEMRGGSTRASTKNLDFYSNNFESSASLAKNARYSLRNENTNNYPSGFRRSELPNDRDTPFFTASATSVKGSREIGFGFKDAPQEERTSSHQRLEGHYKNLVQMTINQVDKLKAKREELCKQQDQIKRSEDENYEKRMVELHEKYQDAMKKLQEYFDNSMTKVNEVNSQKKTTLRTKFNENRYLISELSSIINAVENKIQLLSMSQFIEIFDDEYTEIDKICNKIPKTEFPLNDQFFAFPKAPTFHVTLDDNPAATITQSQPLALPDDFSIGMSLVRNEDLESLGTTSRTIQLTSPTAAHLNKENNKEGANFQCSPFISDNALKSSSNYGKKSHEAIRIEDGGLDSSLKPKKSRKPTASSTFETDKSNLENTQPIDRLAMSEAEKQQKKSTYKEVIKKLQHEGKEKDQIIQEMIKSYKELENKYYKELRDLKPKKTSSLSSPKADENVLKSISNTMYGSRATPHSSTSSLTQSRNKRPSSISKQRAPLDPRSANEAFASFTEVDKEYDEYKKNLENKQRIQWVDEKTSGSETTKNQSLKSSMTDTREKKSTSTVRFSDLPPQDSQQSNLEGTMIDEIKFGDSLDALKKVAIYIPFGQPVYSNYYAANLQKNTSVDEILQGLLIQLGMNDSRAYRYYLAIKSSDNQPDKTLLSSENVYEHLGSECDQKLNSWPRLYLRSYDNKFTQS